jgi:hypothetical protein
VKAGFASVVSSIEGRLGDVEYRLSLFLFVFGLRLARLVVAVTIVVVVWRRGGDGSKLNSTIKLEHPIAETWTSDSTSGKVRDDTLVAKVSAMLCSPIRSTGSCLVARARLSMLRDI